MWIALNVYLMFQKTQAMGKQAEQEPKRFLLFHIRVMRMNQKHPGKTLPGNVEFSS